MHQRRVVLLSADLLDNRGTIDVWCRLSYFFFISSSDCVGLGRIVMPGQSRRCILCGRWDRCAQSLFMTIECAEQQRRIRGGYRRKYSREIGECPIGAQMHRSCYRTIIKQQPLAVIRSKSDPGKYTRSSKKVQLDTSAFFSSTVVSFRKKLVLRLWSMSLQPISLTKPPWMKHVHYQASPSMIKQVTRIMFQAIKKYAAIMASSKRTTIHSYPFRTISSSSTIILLPLDQDLNTPVLFMMWQTPLRCRPSLPWYTIQNNWAYRLIFVTSRCEEPMSNRYSTHLQIDIKYAERRRQAAISHDFCLLSAGSIRFSCIRHVHAETLLLFQSHEHRHRWRSGWWRLRRRHVIYQRFATDAKQP